MRTKSRSAVGAAAATVLVLALSSCTSGVRQPRVETPPSPVETSTTVDVSPDSATRATTKDVTIAMQAGAFSQAGSLTVSLGKATTEATISDVGLVQGGPLIQVSVDGTTLTGRATIKVAIPDQWAKGIVPVMVWEDGSGGWQWLPTTVRDGADGQHLAVARTGHFSNGFLGGFDPSAAAKTVLKKLTNLIVGRSGVASPHCDGQAMARETLTVRSDSGDAVKWCVGVQDGQPVLKVANNRRIFATVAVPLSSHVTSGAGWGISVNNLVRLVGEGMERFAAAFPQDRQILLLGPGKTVTIALPTSTTGGAQISASVSGYLLSILVDAVDMAVTTFGAAGLKAATNGEAVFNLLGSGSGSRSEWAQATFTCMRHMTDEFTDDLAAPLDGADELAKVMRFAGKCGAEIGRASIDDSGVLGWLVSASAATVVSIVTLVYGLVEKLFAGIRETIDLTASLFGSKNDPEYDVVTVPKVDRSLLGTSWYVHGGNLRIRSDGTAQSVSHGVCLDSWNTSDWCNNIDDFTVTLTATGATLTVVKSYVRNEQTGQTGVHTAYSTPLGTRFTVTRYLDDYLLTERYLPNGAAAGDAYGNGLGNPYLCKPGTTDPEHLCGA